MLAGDVRVAFTCPRRIGRIRLLGSSPTKCPPLSELGFDPLTAMVSLERFVSLLSEYRQPVKALLLDQNVIAGCGNWIVDEVSCVSRPSSSYAALNSPWQRCSAVIFSPTRFSF